MHNELSIIKVCGMRDANNIREIEQLGKEISTLNSQISNLWLGFIFWPKSSRYVSKRPEYLPTACKRVGVFVDEDIEQVKRIANEFKLDYIQLHGSESTDYCACLNQYSIIKAFCIATPDDLMQTKSYEGHVDYFLFDTKGKYVGGNGQKFDWSVLNEYAGKTPFLLSGGIGPDDAERVSAFHHPRCVGIDLNSRFELAPGVKDAIALRQFITKLTHKSYE
jgi:phosphoribosylanthranilate isomerase